MNYRLKSEIKMDKRKLIQIIEKELEELKVITEEVSEKEKDSKLIIDIALGKARVLCNEIELLRSLAEKESDDQDVESGDSIEENEEESDVAISDPELEIAEPGEEIEEVIGISPDEFDEADAIEEGMDDDLTDEEDEEADDASVETEKDLIEFEHGSSLVDEIEEKTELREEKTEYEIDPQMGFSEINIDETEDEPAPLKNDPANKEPERPVIREIPKPETIVSEKKASPSSFQKGHSLNDTISEAKTSEPNIKTGPIASLRAAIGLNDRFLFVREIFGNNTDKYNKVIDHLDKLETIQQAVDYLKSQLTLQKNETSLKFVELLKRRFTK